MSDIDLSATYEKAYDFAVHDSDAHTLGLRAVEAAVRKDMVDRVAGPIEAHITRLQRVRGRDEQITALQYAVRIARGQLR